MEHAASDRVSISQADQGTTENDDGAETETTERGTAQKIDLRVYRGKGEPDLTRSR